MYPRADLVSNSALLSASFIYPKHTFNGKKNVVKQPFVLPTHGMLHGLTTQILLWYTIYSSACVIIELFILCQKWVRIGYIYNKYIIQNMEGECCV